MSNFQINFTIPWLLLLLIPAVFLTLLPYFRSAKRYRRTRNRITSIVLHMIIMVLCISVLSGMTFSYDKVNRNAEVVYVVDYSYSSDSQQINSEKSQFVLNAIDRSRGNFRVGVVAYGYNQHTIVEPSSDTAHVREAYLRFLDSDTSTNIDDTATDVSSAILYAADMIKNKQGAKIVLVTDGVETDGKAANIINTLVAQGIKVDAVKLPSTYSSTLDDVQIVDVQLSEDIKVATDFEINVTLQSSITTTVSLDITDSLADNDEEEDGGDSEVDPNRTFVIEPGVSEHSFVYKFDSTGVHKLQITANVQADPYDANQRNDPYEQNNVYYTYYDLISFNRILILEGYKDYGKLVADSLEVNNIGEANNVTRININPEDGDFENIPRTALEMCESYDQIILVNVANSDLTNIETAEDARDGMPENFPKELNKFAKQYGGGVLVVGGNDPTETVDDGDGGTRPKPHGLAFEDMKNADEAYSDMLPVVVEDFKPPVALALVIDTSGSMGTSTGEGRSILYYTQQGAKAILDDGLTHRDYVCVIQLTDVTADIMDMTSVRTNTPAIRAAIDRLTAGNGTKYAPSLSAAVTKLQSLDNDQVSRRHIILISDGDAKDDYQNADGTGYYDVVLKAAQDPIKPVSFSMIQFGNDNRENMENLVGISQQYTKNGSYHNVTSGEANQIGQVMSNELKSKSITAYSFSSFRPEVPTAYRGSDILKDIPSNNNYEAIPQLGGFFASREKNNTDVYLTGPMVPLYVQWRFGEGRVGTFMSALDGQTTGGFNFTGDFLKNGSNGERILRNMVSSLMPTYDIRPKNIDVLFSDDNYRSTLSIYSSLEEGQRIRVKVYDPTQDVDDIQSEPQVVFMDSSSRATVEIRQPGVHTLVVEKLSYENNRDGEVIDSVTLYKSFSYSEEYDSFVDLSLVDEYLSNIATAGKGNVVSSANMDMIYDNIDNIIHKNYDPRFLFIIISIILFLLDVAVRKFKFKWIHEIIRDRKERQKLMGK